MTAWMLSRHNALVLVEADKEIIQSILSRVSPYLQGKELCGERPHEVWLVQARCLAPSHASLNNQKRLSYNEPFVAIDPLARVIVVEEAREQLVVQRAIRLLRNLFRLLLARNALFVHGGMIQVGGYGIAFLGEKHAGKTSSLLAVLTQAQASFIENDSLSFHFLGARPYGLGWFRSAYIRRDVFSVLEAVFLERKLEPQYLEWAREKLSLSPESFATVFDCTLLPQAELHLLIFPAFLPRDEPPAFSLLPMTRKEALIALKEHIVAVPNAYHQFLLPHFSLASENTDFLEKLVALVPCYRLQQSFSAIFEAAQSIIALTDANINGFSMSNDVPYKTE